MKKNKKIVHIVKKRGFPPRIERNKLILKNINLRDVKNILDVGCGLGEFLESLSKNIEKFGIDVSTNHLSVCKKHTDGHFLLLDIDKKNLPFNSNCFDLVTCIGIVEHVKNPTHLIEEIYRVTKNQAVFMTQNLGRPSRLISAALKKEHSEFSGHKQGWDYHLFKQFLEINGWQVNKIITRFVDCPFHKYLPKFIVHFLSYKLLLKIFPRIGSELFVFCSKSQK